MSSDHFGDCDLTYVRVQDDDIKKKSGDLGEDDHSADEPTIDEEHKLNTTVNLQTILDNLNQNIDNLIKDASLIVDKKLVSHGVWDAELKIVNIISNKCPKQYIPHFKDNRHYLNPLEALFTMECRALSISYENILLSIEDAYKLLLSNKRDTLLYRIFSMLSRNGYFVYHCMKDLKGSDHAVAMEETESSQLHLKRALDDDSIGLQNICKKSNILLTTQNYKAITSIRPLSISHLPKLTRIDRKLIACSSKESNSDKLRSILYCVRNSAVPIEINKKLKPLHSADIKPLVNLSAVYSTDQLFDLIKNSGPKSLPNELRENLQSQDFKRSFYSEIDFKIFTSQKELSNQSISKPLFVVIVVDQNDPFPSVSDIVCLQKRYSNSPLCFALVSPSLDFNFYSIERLSLNDEYPTLWEKFFSPS